MSGLSIAGLSLVTFAALAPEEPFAVVFDSHVLDPSARAAALSLQWQFDQEPRKSKPVLDHSQIIARQFRSLWRIGKEKEFTFVSGNAHYFNRASGRFRHVRFMSSPSREAFDEFVRDECARRTSVKIDGTKSRFTITSPPEPASGDRPAITWHDASFSYHNGLFAYGSGGSALRADFKPLAPLAREARGKDWYMVVQPQHAPDEAKRAFLKRYVPRWAMLMQKRDKEDDATHKSRYAEYDLYRAVLNALVRDSESVKCAIQAPREKSGYSVDAEFIFKKGTTSAAGIQALVPRRSRIGVHPDGVLASIACSVVLPQQVREVFKATSGISDDSLLAILIDQAARSETLNSHLQIRWNPKSSALTASGEIPWSPDYRLADIAVILDDGVVDSDRLVFPISLGEDAPYRVTASLHRKKTACRFSVAQQIEAEDAPTTRTEGGRQGRIFSGRLDLTVLAQSTEPSGDLMRLLELLENAYHTSATTVPGRPAAQGIAPAPAKSLLPKLSGIGDWTAQFDVDVVGKRGLRIRLRIGRELYGLLQARKRQSLAARTSFLKSRRELGR